MKCQNIILLLLISATEIKAEGCQALADKGNCMFYRECVEKEKCCGSKWYALAFGEKYCKKFEKEMKCFNSQGQIWVKNSTICLMQALAKDDAYKNQPSCKVLEITAFASHTKCYLESGFCDAILDNFANMQCLDSVLNGQDPIIKVGIEQVIETAIRCHRDEVFSFQRSVLNETGQLSPGIIKSFKQYLDGCRSGLDLMFVLDASGSVGRSYFRRMINFVVNTVKGFRIGPTGTHIGIIRFSSANRVSIVIPLGSNNNKVSLINSINDTMYTGGLTATHEALNKTIEAFSNSRKIEGVPQVAIVVTDGQSNNRDLTVAEAVKVREKGIQVFSVGVANANDEELVLMSYDPTTTDISQNQYVFHIDNFQQSSFAEILLLLQIRSCSASARGRVNETVNGVLGENTTRNLEYDLPEAGATIIVTSTSSAIVRYSCKVPNPDDSTADYSKQFKGKIEYYAKCNDPPTGCITLGFRKRQAPPVVSKKLYVSIESLANETSFTVNAIDGDVLTRDDICRLPPDTGPCKGAFSRWFFNPDKSQCELFTYSGCQGNQNRFGSLSECIRFCGCSFSLDPGKTCSSDICDNTVCPDYPNAACYPDVCSDCSPRYFIRNTEVTEVCDFCTFFPDSGSCTNDTVRWYFNYAFGRCQQFIYGGCGGNRNKFKSLEKCLQGCGKKCDDDELVQCLINPCDVAQCPNIPDSICVPSSCGQCSARFYNSSGYDVTNQCSSCPPDKPPIYCATNPCDHQTCSNIPNAQCVLDNCGQCRAKFINNGTDVTTQCSQTGSCSIEGSIFKPCGAQCNDTCTTRRLYLSVVCLPYCKPGCACPAGQIIDEFHKRCVYPDQCSCPPCIPHASCPNPQIDRCGCPICADNAGSGSGSGSGFRFGYDCSIAGQVYQQKRTCPKTCSNPDISCDGNAPPGCGCPPGQLIDEDKKRCVDPNNCPKPNPCNQPLVIGPGYGAFPRYFYNTTSQKCEKFLYRGSYGNENNFFTQYQCQQKCSACPPTCTSEFCTVIRDAICTIPSTFDCQSNNCTITNCQACYYSYNTLPFPQLPPSCPQQCNDILNEDCMKKWGRCVRRSYSRIYKTGVQPHEVVPENFRCWYHKSC